MARRRPFKKRSNQGNQGHHKPPPQATWRVGDEPLTKRQANYDMGVGFVDPEKMREVLEGLNILCWGCGRHYRIKQIGPHRLACNSSAIELGIIVAPSVKVFKSPFLGLVGWRQRCDQAPLEQNRLGVAVGDYFSFREKYSVMMGSQPTTLHVNI